MAADHGIDPARWQEMFEVLMGCIARRSARVEPRRRAREFALGLLSDLPRKSCWTLAENAGGATGRPGSPRRSASPRSPHAPPA